MHNDASAGLEHDGLDGGEPGGGVLGSSASLMAGDQPCKPPRVKCHPKPGSQGGREVNDGTTGSFLLSVCGIKQYCMIMHGIASYCMLLHSIA